VRYKRIVAVEQGGPEVLRLVEEERSAPAKSEVRVRMLAAGLSRLRCGLLIFAGVSLFTGFKVRFLPVKPCPFVFTSASVLMLFGGVLR
jgi:NADPH:quinone reductase-like Zn-dependent oxidoreductase